MSLPSRLIILLELEEDDKTIREISESTGIRPSTLYSAIAGLKKHMLIEELNTAKPTRYRITQDGEKYLRSVLPALYAADFIEIMTKTTGYLAALIGAASIYSIAARDIRILIAMALLFPITLAVLVATAYAYGIKPMKELYTTTRKKRV